MASFYKNLEELYQKYQYPSDHVWNCNESGAQARRSGRGRKWTKESTRSVHTLLPNEREWLIVLTCINAAGQHIPGFYIFRGKRIRDNYIRFCEDGAAMAMQSEAWMTQFLFSSLISHFINSLGSQGGISCENRHLLIVDGHNSHVTLEVVKKSMEVGLDLVTLPSHTSHRLQPLDVSVFAPFKHGFKWYKDAWVLHNRGTSVEKQVLAMWVSGGLQRALTLENIKAGFHATSIWPLNPHAVDQYLGLAMPFSISRLLGAQQVGAGVEMPA